MAIANGSPYYVAPALLKQFEDEVAPVMAFFASPGERVVVRNPLDADYYRDFGKTGIAFVLYDELRETASSSAPGEMRLIPWGHSPAEAETFSFMNKNKSLWNSKLKSLFERKTSLDFLRSFLLKNPDEKLFDSVEVPEIAESIDDCERLLSQWRQVVVKAPLSSSGRGLQILRKGRINEANKQWIGAVLEQQGYVCVEPWLDKILDLSFQFQLSESGSVGYLGNSWFFTNSNGQYGGHYLNFRLPDYLLPYREKLHLAAAKLCEELENSPFTASYSGPLGIDALFFRNAAGTVQLQPCIEINPRFTMGNLCLQLEKLIDRDTAGEFRILFDPRGELEKQTAAKAKKNPPIWVDGLFRKGFRALTPVGSGTKFGACLELF